MQETTNREWINKLREIIDIGRVSNPRGMRIKEILNSHTEVDMNYPILSVKSRKLGYKFNFRESWYILDGRNDVESIRDYSKMISSFSNNGIFYDGSYGLMVLDQLSYIVDILSEDIDSRQAVLTIWRPNPRPSKDIPCTVSLQWIIRNNKIYCFDTMRSSDIWLGWPYDIHNMTMITGFIMLMLREKGINNLQLGTISLNAGSQHLYENNWEKAIDVLNDNESFEYTKFNPYLFDSPMDFKHYLKALSECNSKKLSQYRSCYGQDVLQI